MIAYSSGICICNCTDWGGTILTRGVQFNEHLSIFFWNIQRINIYIDKICSAQIADPKQKQNKKQQTELMLTDRRQVMKRKKKTKKSTRQSL